MQVQIDGSTAQIGPVLFDEGLVHAHTEVAKIGVDRIRSCVHFVHGEFGGLDGGHEGVADGSDHIVAALVQPGVSFFELEPSHNVDSAFDFVALGEHAQHASQRDCRRRRNC